MIQAVKNFFPLPGMFGLDSFLGPFIKKILQPFMGKRLNHKNIVTLMVTFVKGLKERKDPPGLGGPGPSRNGLPVQSLGKQVEITQEGIRKAIVIQGRKGARMGHGATIPTVLSTECLKRLSPQHHTAGFRITGCRRKVIVCRIDFLKI